MNQEILKARAEIQAWAEGRPTYLLDAGQRSWVQRFISGEGHAVWCIGRQRGKTFAALAMACEFAMNKPNSIIRYAAKTKESAKGIVKPTLDQLLNWCPPELAPKIDEGAASATWRNGSTITWAGTDAQSFDRLRGPRAHLVILDESAFYQDLESVESALLPQLTTTGGKALYLSTPPESIGHPFAQRFMSAKASGRSEAETIHDNPRLTPEQCDAILRAFADMRGLTPEAARASTFWRREYLAEFVVEESRAALPAYTLESSQEIVREWSRPIYRDHYVSLDIGYHDGHGVLFAYWDFKAQVLVIEDEVFLRGKTTDDLSEAIKEKERALFGADKFDGTLAGAKDFSNVPDYVRKFFQMKTQPQPYLRVADDAPLILADIIQRHGIAFLPTRKDDKAAAVDDLNIAIQRRQIVIHPRCKTLHRQLLTTIWDNHRRGWERNTEGHGEGVDCLVYLWRNVRKHRNPEPQKPKDTFTQYIENLHGRKTEWGNLGRIRKGEL